MTNRYPSPNPRTSKQGMAESKARGSHPVQGEAPSRRAMLQWMGMGALVVAPGGLVGCIKQTGVASVSSSSPFPELSPPVLRRLLGILSNRGADLADVYAQRTIQNRIRLEDGIISEASTRIDQGVGLRTCVGDRTGYAFSEQFEDAALDQAARTAAAIAREGTAKAVPEAFQSGASAGLYRLALPWTEVGADKKIPLLQEAERVTRSLDPSVSRVTVTWFDQTEEVLLATLDGRIRVDSRPLTRLWVEVTCSRDGKTFSNGSNIAGREGLAWYSSAKLREVCQQAVDRTLILFEARRPPAGELPVILAAGASGILLHEAIGHGLEADFNRKKTSIYSDMMGKEIAPPFVNIVDSAVEPHALGAVEVDDEGNTGKKTTLVENGRLVSYIHDAISAQHYGVSPTGNGRRQSFRHVPMPRMRCTYMEDGPHSVDEIISSVQSGIIAETFTNGQVQIGAGDFTFYIKNGWLIEGGKKTAPIKDVNIIGNGPEALRRVKMAANDSRLDTGGWTCGKDGQSVSVSQGLPTVLVEKLNVGGADA
jgi:TldD protein